MSILDTAEYRRLALIAAGVDPCDIPCILDTAAWRRLMLQALYDLSQGGGGSPGYITGSVQFYADLPVTVGTPAVNTAYLVRENSGVWFINRKPAGIYVRLFNNGNLNDWDYAGTFPEVNDAQYFRIYDSADPTREVAFNVSGVAAATTRTLTVPNANGTIALTSDIPPAFNPASPGPIGNVTPAAGTFTNLVANTELQLPSAAPASPSAGDIYRVTDTIRYRDSGNTERLLLNATDNLSNLANTATACTNIGLGSANSVTFGSLQNTPIGSTTRNSGAFTSLSAAPTSGSALTLTGGTVTTSAPVLDATQTWNASGTTFTALRLNATNTASATASLLMDLQTGGTTQFSVRRDGVINAANYYRFTGLNSGLFVHSAGGGIISIGDSPNNWMTLTSTRMQLTGDLSLGRALSLGQAADTILARDAANTLAQVNGTNAQESRLYGTFTSSTNYQRMTIKSVRQTLSALSGASATTTGTFIPDGAVVVGVTTRVATLLTGATGYTIGDGTDADRWGDITGTAIGTTSDNRDWTAGTIECFTAGGNITLTAKTSNFTAGAIEICVFYLAGEAD